MQPLGHGGDGGIAGRIRRFLGGTIHEESQNGINNYENKRSLFYIVAFSLVGCILFAFGLVLLLKTWTPANFHPSANVHVLPRVGLSALLMWSGMAILFWIFGMLP